MPSPDLAIGILSAVVPHIHPLRREAIRGSWLRFQGPWLAKFVLRCGGVQDASAHVSIRKAAKALTAEMQRHNDTLCTPLPASEGRLRGPVQTLHWWVRHALTVACTTCRWIAKADDDTYIHVPDVLRYHLAALPAEGAAHAYYGYSGYYSLVERRGDYFGFHGFAPHHQAATMTLRHLQLGAATGGDLARLSRKLRVRHGGERNATVTAGPFPFACGPFLALGHRLAAAFAHSQQIADDVAALSALPEEGHPLVVEDAWLGSVLWRHLRHTTPVHLFQLNTAWGKLYSDGDGFQVHPAVAIWHNRRKVTARVRMLYEFAAMGHHCSMRVRWLLLRRHCCGRRTTAGAPVGVEWPVWTARIDDASSCAARPAVNLRNTTTLRALGVIDRLRGVDLWRKERLQRRELEGGIRQKRSVQAEIFRSPRALRL